MLLLRVNLGPIKLSRPRLLDEWIGRTFMSINYTPRFGLENAVGTLSLYPYLLQSSLALWILVESIEICTKFGLNSP
jgi:hypothetical protein